MADTGRDVLKTVQGAPPTAATRRQGSIVAASRGSSSTCNARSARGPGFSAAQPVVRPVSDAGARTGTDQQSGLGADQHNRIRV